MDEIVLGLEACVAERRPTLKGRRIGLLMNRASVDRDLRLACDVLNDAYPGQLRALFTPQHGLWGDAQANMVETQHQWHTRLKLPIHSLYSETRFPTPSMLADVDCLVIDLQDVGTRVYTFIWTVLECMRACAELGVSILILDRPNPIGGNRVEGPWLRSGFTSFVGGAPMPMRHGLTIGELARWIRSELSIDVSLDVVPLQGWNASSSYPSSGRVWIPPSPNLPSISSAVVYPGQVLLEGTNISEGRGTTTPFEVFGAPFIDPEEITSELALCDLAGIAFLPTRFCPAFDKWAGDRCGGASLHITDANQFRPVQTTLAIVQCIIRRYGNRFRWLEPPYEYERIKRPIDIIFGSSELRKRADTGDSILDLADIDSQVWFERTRPYQLYPRPGHMKES